MSTKKYLASSMKEALKKVKDDLGDEAIILSNRRLKQGRIEIVAKLEETGLSATGDIQTIRSNGYSTNVPSADSEKIQQSASRIISSKSLTATELPAKELTAKMKGSEKSKKSLDLSDEQAELIIKSFNQSRGKVDFNPKVSKRANNNPQSLMGVAKADQLIKHLSEKTGPVRSKDAAPMAPSLTRENLFVKTLGEEVLSLRNELEDIKNSQKEDHRKLVEIDQSAERSLNIIPEPRVDNASLSQEISEIKSILSEYLTKEKLPLHLPQSISKPLPQKGHWRQSPTLVKRLEQLGFSEELANRLLIDMHESGLFSQTEPKIWSCVNYWLKANVKVKECMSLKQGKHVFVGPTGSGKTTSLAKIAANYVMNNGPDGLAILSMDTFRAGAYDQISTLGKLLKVPVDMVQEDQALATYLKKYQNYPMVLIDTGGFAFNNIQGFKRLEHTVRSIAGLSFTLVLPATHQTGIQQQTVLRFKEMDLDSAIITKCDEALTIAGSLEVLANNQIPVSYLCDGQQVPDDIHAFNSQLALTWMEKMEKESFPRINSSLSCDSVVA